MDTDPRTAAMQAIEDAIRKQVQAEFARRDEFLQAGRDWLLAASDPRAGAVLRDTLARLDTARKDTAAMERRTQAVDAMTAAIQRCEAGGAPLDGEEWDALVVAAQRILEPSSATPEIRDIMDWDGTPVPESVLEGPRGGLVYRRQVSILSGAGGAGKSQLALQWMSACAIAHATGGEPVVSAGMKCKPVKSVYFAYEDEPAWMVYRAGGVLSLPHLQSRLAGFAAQKEALQGRLGLTDMTGRPIYRGKLSNEYPSPTEHWQQMWDIADSYEASLVVIDPIAKSYRGNTADLTAVGGFMDDLHAEARRRDLAVLLLGHSTKGGRREKDRDETGMVAGSANWTDSARAALHLDSGQQRKLHVIKTNHGPRRVGMIDPDGANCWLAESISFGRLCGFEECLPPDGEDSGSGSGKTGADGIDSAIEQVVTEQAASEDRAREIDRG